MAEQKQDKTDEKVKAPFFVWPWIICQTGEIGPHWKGVLMCIGMFGTAAGVKMCEPQPIWCLGSAVVALTCSILSQMEIFRTGNLKRIHHGLEYKNKSIAAETKVLKFSMDRNEEQLEEVFDCEKNLERQVEKIEKIAGKQASSRETFSHHVEKLLEQREKIKASFDVIEKTLDNIYSSDDQLADELDMFKILMNDLINCEAEMTEDLSHLHVQYITLNKSKRRMDKELGAFKKMRKTVEDAGVKWTKDIIGMTESMKFKYQDLFQLCMTFSTNFLKEIVHNIEYMDGNAGWTWNKFQELLRRLPNNVRAKADFRQIRKSFRSALMEASAHKEAKLLGYNAVPFEVFQKEIVQKLLLPLCDVFSSGADNVVVDTDSEMSEVIEIPKSAEVTL